MKRGTEAGVHFPQNPRACSPLVYPPQKGRDMAQRWEAAAWAWRFPGLLVHALQGDLSCAQVRAGAGPRVPYCQCQTSELVYPVSAGSRRNADLPPLLVHCRAYGGSQRFPGVVLTDPKPLCPCVLHGCRIMLLGLFSTWDGSIAWDKDSSSTSLSPAGSLHSRIWIRRFSKISGTEEFPSNI